MNEYKNEYKIKALRKFFLHISCPWVLKTLNPALTCWMVRWTRLFINLKKKNYLHPLCSCCWRGVTLFLSHPCQSSCEEQVDLVWHFCLNLNLWKECIVTKLFGNICIKHVIVKVCNINEIMLHVESCSRESLSPYTFKSMDRKLLSSALYFYSCLTLWLQYY